MRFSLKSKIALTVCLLLLGTLSMAAFLSLRFFSQEFKKNITAQQFNMITKIAEDIDLQISTGKELITRTAMDFPPEILADPEQIQRYLDQRLGIGTVRFFDNGIFLFSSTGILLAEYPFKAERRGKSYAFRDYFIQTIASRQPQVSDPYLSSQEHHHPAINFTAPIFDRSGQLCAVIAGSVDLSKDNFLGGLSKFRVGQSGYLYLYNTDRLMIMHPDPQRIMQKDVPLGANLLFDRAIAGFEGSEETINSRGIAMLASFKHLATTNWILAANYPTAEAFASVARSQRYIAIGLFLLLALSTLAVWLVTGYLSRPLLTFTEHVQRLTSTDSLRTPLEISTTDEIGLLGQAFNRLMIEVEEQKELSTSRLRFLQILSDAIPNPIYYKDLERRYLGCNRAYEEVRGVTRAKLIGKTSSEIFNDDATKAQELDEFELLHDSDLPADIAETTLTYRDGSRHDLLIYKAVYRDEEGLTAGLVGTMVDITSRKEIESALAEQQQFSENLLQNSAVPCFVLDSNHQVIIWNRACEELTGLTTFDVLGTDQHWRAFYPEERPCLADLILDHDIKKTVDLYQTFSTSQLIADGLQAEGWYANIGGKRRYLSFEAAPIRDREGKIIAAIETLQDHSSLKHTEEALRQSEESYRSLIELSPDAILVHHHGKVIFVNHSAATLFAALEPKELTGVKVMDLFHPDYRAIEQERINRVEIDQKSQPYLDEKILRIDGKEVDVEASSTPVFYRDAWSVQTIIRDISERKEVQEQIWRQANFDTLTQIPNRLLFNDRLLQAIERAARENYSVALMFIDLDHFKEINDTLGHDAGDVLLQQAAKRMSESLRKSDTLARMGGDEFTVIMPCIINPPDVCIVAKRLLTVLRQPFALPGGEGLISASIGIAFYPAAMDLPLLIQHADSAMYRAKEGGRNGFCFYDAAEPNQCFEPPSP